MRLRDVTPRLPVRELGRTLAFYSGALGFGVVGQWPAGMATFAILDRDGIEVQFHAEEGVGSASPAGRATLCFDVEDARAFLQSLGGRVDVEWGPEVYWYGRREFAFRDPDGHLLIVGEETDDPPTCLDG